MNYLRSSQMLKGHNVIFFFNCYLTLTACYLNIHAVDRYQQQGYTRTVDRRLHIPNGAVLRGSHAINMIVEPKTLVLGDLGALSN